jgi:cyclase
LDYSFSETLYTIRKSESSKNIDELSSLVEVYIGTGAGEIVVTNVERDGARAGLDFSLLDLVNRGIGVPILLSGGAHSAENFAQAFAEGADGVLSGTYMAKMDQNLLQLRSKIAVSGINVRRIK